MTITTGLADVTGLSNIREENAQAIFFEYGVAERFSSFGSLGSLIGLLGVSLFLSLARRRGLLVFLLNCKSAVLVWLAVRSVGWVILLQLGTRHGTWYEWTTFVEIVSFVVGGLMIISLDTFWAAIMQPIPFEYLNLDFPIFALAWNWMCGLPKLTISVPQRESDFGPMEDEPLEEFA